MIVLVCGSRSAAGHGPVWNRLDRLQHKIRFLVAGDADGVDAFALSWAKIHGKAHAMFPACWDHYGRAAGPMRNTWMVRFGRPDLVLAFRGGKGTRSMVEIATRAGIEVELVEE